MPQRTGGYRHRIIIQDVTETLDAAGEPVRSWSEYAVRWATVRTLSGLEAFREGVVRRAERSVEFRTHLTRGIGPKMRVLRPAGTAQLTSVVTGATQSTLDVDSADEFPGGGAYRVRVADELMEVTSATAGTTWTVTRGVDGTTAATAYATGQVVQLMQAYDVGQAYIDWEYGAETVIEGVVIDAIS